MSEEKEMMDYEAHNAKAALDLVKEKAKNERLRERVAELELAIDTELVTCHIGTLESMKSPRHALASLADWNYKLGVSRLLEKSK